MSEQLDQLGTTVAATASTEHVHLDSSVIDKIGTLVKAAAAVQEVGDTYHLVLPDDHKHIDITDAVRKARPHPSRKTGTAALGDIDSFIAYVKAQGEPNRTVIYADPDSRTLTAVFNDHEECDAENSLAGWRDFRAVYAASLSREFSNWQSMHTKPMEQEQFAIFLEDNIADIVEPSGETLLQVALTLQAKTAVDFSSSKRLDNGQVQLTYTETIDARAGNGSIEIPREFAIGCRLFKNGDGYKIHARLKYRLGAGRVKFWYELDRHENALEDAFKAYVEKASKETGYPVLIGRP